MDWKKNAKLFVGSFKVLLPAHKPYAVDIEGCYNHRLGVLIPPEGLKWFHLDECVLVVREPSDMTEDERKIHQYKQRGQVLRGQHEPIFHETPESFMYQLSIGVLPDEFNTVDKSIRIINRNETKDEE